MDLVAISSNEMINVDLIEAIEIRKNKKGDKSIILTVGGKQYIPEIDQMELLKSLIKSGVSNSANQFFSV
jgi:hypothetical protein